MGNPTVVLAVLALLVFVGLGLEELFRRTRIPDVLVLLGLGIVAGATGLVDTSQLGGLAQIFTTSALVLILFESATQMRLADLRSALGGAVKITALGFFASMLAVAAVSIVFMGMRPLAGLLLGSIIGGTSSAVVIPIVQMVRLRRDTRTALELEAALTDVFCIVFALVFLGTLSAQSLDVATIGTDLAIGFLGAIAIGVALGLLWAFGLRALRQRRASFVALGAAVFLVYALAETLGNFGAIACLAFGVVLGNAPSLARRAGDTAGLELASGERLFLSEVAFVLKVFFFVYLGASLDLAAWQPWVCGVLACVAVFAVRPLVVRLALRPAVTPRQDAAIASALVPKGLAAAVLASVPAQAGLPEGKLIEAAAVGTVLVSIVLASALVYAIDWPLVRGFYDRFFRSYPETLPDAVEDTDGSVVSIGHATDGQIEEAPEAPPEARKEAG